MKVEKAEEDRGYKQRMPQLPMVVGYRSYVSMLWNPISPALSPATWKGIITE